MENKKYEPIYNIGAYEIQQYQQNRYPLFFLDVVEEVIPGEYVRAKKNFTYDEWFFPAHFADGDLLRARCGDHVREGPPGLASFRRDLSAAAHFPDRR